MGTLYIDRKDLHIRLDGNALAFYANGERKGIVPLAPLKRIVIVGQATIETHVVHRLFRENISVLFISGKRLRFSGMLQGSGHYNAVLRLRQYGKTLDASFSLEYARDLVARKVEGQKALLQAALDRRPDIRLPLFSAIETITGIRTKITAAGDMDILRGLEGSSAAAYFSAYTELFPPSLSFTKRVKRPPTDPVNALLSLGYTLLHWEMVREIQIIGLDPLLGFLHQFEYGRESLACDLVEPFRPAVDRRVWELFRDRTFTERDFTEGEDRPGCYLKKEARKRYYERYEEWASGQRTLWTEEVRALARRINNGQDPVPEGEQRFEGEEGRSLTLDS